MFGIYRFLLATNVVLYHLLGVPEIGPLAVYSFFILSGFLMTTIMHDTYGYSLTGAKKYFLNRFLRLYPLYWSLLLLTFASIWFIGNDFSREFHPKMFIPETSQQFIANLGMIFPDFNPAEYPNRLHPATWALTIELFFYFLIGIGLSRSKLLTIFWLAISLVVTIIYNLSGSYGIGYGNIFTASLPFSLGASIYFYKDAIHSVLRKLTGDNHLFFFSTIFLITLLVSAFSSQLFHPDIAWKVTLLLSVANLFNSAIMVVVLYHEKAESRQFRWLDRYLGDLSYPLYVFHWTAALWITFVAADLALSGINRFFLSLILAIAVSTVTNKYINERVESLRNRIKKLSRQEMN
jgi:peptidoglycan/LPS O-acetylase OafA/YrhL